MSEAHKPHLGFVCSPCIADDCGEKGCAKSRPAPSRHIHPKPVPVPQALALLQEAFDLIWNQDAAYVEGGSEKLDELAVRIGKYLGVPDDHLTPAR